MGRQGIPFTPDHEDMRQAFIDKMGHITNIAKLMHVTKDTIYRYMKEHPDIKVLLDQVREYNEDADIDNSEMVLRHTLTLSDQPKLRLEAAKYILDNRGAKRGWGNTKQEADIRGFVQDKITHSIAELYEKEALKVI